MPPKRTPNAKTRASTTSRKPSSPPLSRIPSRGRSLTTTPCLDDDAAGKDVRITRSQARKFGGGADMMTRSTSRPDHVSSVTEGEVGEGDGYGVRGATNTRSTRSGNRGRNWKDSVKGRVPASAAAVGRSTDADMERDETTTATTNANHATTSNEVTDIPLAPAHEKAIRPHNRLVPIPTWLILMALLVGAVAGVRYSLSLLSSATTAAVIAAVAAREKEHGVVLEDVEHVTGNPAVTVAVVVEEEDLLGVAHAGAEFL